jgi:hypothetical protein
MKFLCIDCDHVMEFTERAIPGDGTMAAVFSCARCGREIAMLANPMETQLVSSLGVKVGGREVPEQPMELTRTSVADGGDDAFRDADPAPADAPGVPRGKPRTETGSPADSPGTAPESPATRRVTWSPDAQARLEQVPSFVRGMVKRIYTDYARERGIDAITPAVMDRARSDLGLEGM